MDDIVSWKANDELKLCLSYKYKPYVKRFLSDMAKGIKRFDLISQNSSVLVGLSGGKDSLALLFALELYRRQMAMRGFVFSIKAVKIVWEPSPYSFFESQQNISLQIAEEASFLKDFASFLKVDYTEEKMALPLSMTKNEFGCFSCSKERRRALLECAQKYCCTHIALGHHLDDFAETSLMNLCSNANFNPLRVKAVYFDKFTLIRPLCLILESRIKYLAKNLAFPVIPSHCLLDGKSKRSSYKALLAEMQKVDKLVREHIFEAAWRN